MNPPSSEQTLGTTWRKKPVVVQAARTGDLIVACRGAWDTLPPWFESAYEDGQILIRATCIDIRTLEGTMTADADDWIIQGVQGELYPCKPDIFEATYEPV